MNFEILVVIAIEIVFHLWGYRISAGLGFHPRPVTDYPHNPEHLASYPSALIVPFSFFFIPGSILPTKCIVRQDILFRAKLDH